MNNIEKLPLFRDLQFVSAKYNNIQLKNDTEELDNNRRLKSNLQHYTSKMDEINEKCAFISYKTKDDTKDLSSNDLSKIIAELNNFSRKRYDLIKEENIESTTTKVVMFSTIDELTLVNESIKNKDYIENKDAHLYIYHKVTSNAFATFLALKDMNLDEHIMNAFSQAIFNQIKVISVI